MRTMNVNPKFAGTPLLRRVLRLVVLPLLLGLVTTWLIAWGCGLWGQPRSGPGDSVGLFPDDSPDGVIHLVMGRTRGYGVDVFGVQLMLAPTDSQGDGSHFKEFARFDVLPCWTHTYRRWASGQAFPAAVPVYDPRDGAGLMWSEMACGWPFPALRCMSIMMGDGVLGGLPPPKWLPAWRNPPPMPAVPYHPVWSGLLLNTLLFAAVWSGAGVFSGIVLRRWRISQGHCPSCRYDLRGCPDSICPECGSPESLRVLWAARKRSQPIPQPRPPASRNPARRVRLISAVALAIVVLVSLGVVWVHWSDSKPTPDWAALRQSAYTYFAQSEGYSTVASYIDEHFHAAADITDLELAEKAARTKVDVELSDYCLNLQIQFAILARRDGRADVREFIWRLPRVPARPLD
jgi:hypothetical protein